MDPLAGPREDLLVDLLEAGQLVDRLVVDRQAGRLLLLPAHLLVLGKFCSDLSLGFLLFLLLCIHLTDRYSALTEDFFADKYAAIEEGSLIECSYLITLDVVDADLRDDRLDRDRLLFLVGILFWIRTHLECDQFMPFEDWDLEDIKLFWGHVTSLVRRHIAVLFEAIALDVIRVRQVGSLVGLVLLAAWVWLRRVGSTWYAGDLLLLLVVWHLSTGLYAWALVSLVSFYLLALRCFSRNSCLGCCLGCCCLLLLFGHGLHILQATQPFFWCSGSLDRIA